MQVIEKTKILVWCSFSSCFLREMITFNLQIYFLFFFVFFKSFNRVLIDYFYYKINKKLLSTLHMQKSSFRSNNKRNFHLNCFILTWCKNSSGRSWSSRCSHWNIRRWTSWVDIIIIIETDTFHWFNHVIKLFYNDFSLFSGILNSLGK